MGDHFITYSGISCEFVYVSAGYAGHTEVASTAKTATAITANPMGLVVYLKKETL